MAVIKGKTRGGDGLVEYMLGPGQNDGVELLAVQNCISTDPFLASKEMKFIAELSTSKKPFYHGQLSLGKEEGKRITNDQYLDMVDTVRQKLGLPEDVKTIVSKHTKNKGSHIHFDFLLVDPATSKLHSTWKNYYKHDEARQEIEQKYNLTRTPLRSLNKEQRRADTLEAWHSTSTGEEFIQVMKDRNMMIAIGVKDSRPFRLIELPASASVSPKNHNLVREIEGINTAEVRERLKDVKLPYDEQVMEEVRSLNQIRLREAQAEQTRAKVNEAKTESKRVTEKERQRQQDEADIEEMLRRRQRDRGYER